MAKRYSDGNYEGMSGRKTQEAQDGGMIRENPSAIANMPQEVMIKPYPKLNDYLPEDLNDTITEVDRQRNEDAPRRKGGFRPEKLN